MATTLHPDTSSPQATLLERYRRVRAATESLRAPLTEEDQMVQSMPDCSPAKWHAAHTTWFFETFLLSSDRAYKPFDPRFRDVFNSYYKQVGEHPFRGERGTFSRPSLAEVKGYRDHVDAAMERLISAGIDAASASLLELGLNHEQQHQELLLTDIKHAFWSQPLRPAYAGAAASAASDPGPLSFTAFQGREVLIGHEGSGFAYDNESPRHRFLLEPFAIADRLVTNLEYLAFIDDRGYSRPELWLSDGWDTIQRLGWQAPLYWERDARGHWTHFTLAGTQPLASHEPVCHVSYYEADAFSRWAGRRLPRETEWESVAAALPIEGNFVESRRFHPAPASGPGLRQFFGDLWEWTASAYLGYPGYRPVPGAVGEYNGKFMCNQMVLRGGSCATPQSHIRATYRNFFPPHARWQFMGIRLADDLGASR